MKASNEAYSRISQGEIDKVLFYVTKHGEVAGVTAISVASGTNISYQRASMIIEDLVKEDKIHPHDRKGDKRIYYMPGPGEKPVQKVEEAPQQPTPPKADDEKCHCPFEGCKSTYSGKFGRKNLITHVSKAHGVSYSKAKAIVEGEAKPPSHEPETAASLLHAVVNDRLGFVGNDEEIIQKTAPAEPQKAEPAVVGTDPGSIQNEPECESLPPCPVCGKPRAEWGPDGITRQGGVEYCSMACWAAKIPTPKCSPYEGDCNTIALPLSNPVQETQVTRSDEPAPKVTSTLSNDVPTNDRPAERDVAMILRACGKEISTVGDEEGYQTSVEFVEHQENGQKLISLFVTLKKGVLQEERRQPQVFGLRLG